MAPSTDSSRSGSLVFTDDFSAGLTDWQSEGPNLVEVINGHLHIRTTQETGSGQFVWCRTELPADFRVEYDLTPTSPSGFFLIFFCVQGVDGTDVLDPKLMTDYDALPDFKKYTIGPINGYHISYRRNRSADCNLRKNTGKHLLANSPVDAVLDADHTVHVVLIKIAGRITLTVDGQAYMDHTDDGSINGGVYSGGRLGLRQVYDSDGVYDNLKIYDLTTAHNTD